MIFKRTVFRMLLILIILGLIGYIGIIVKIYSYTGTNEAQKADAIVVMGASQWSGQPSPVFKTRLDHAILLYKNGFASKFILTGGVGKGEKISESQVGKNYLVKRGIDYQNIFTEKRGCTSWQSLNQVAQILEKENLDSVILVSDGFHMMRLRQMAKDSEIKAYFSSVRDGLISKSSEIKYIFRESLTYLSYLLFKI